MSKKEKSKKNVFGLVSKLGNLIKGTSSSNNSDNMDTSAGENEFPKKNFNIHISEDNQEQIDLGDEEEEEEEEEENSQEEKKESKNVNKIKNDNDEKKENIEIKDENKNIDKEIKNNENKINDEILTDEKDKNKKEEISENIKKENIDENANNDKNEEIKENNIENKEINENNKKEEMNEDIKKEEKRNEKEEKRNENEDKIKEENNINNNIEKIEVKNNIIKEEDKKESKEKNNIINENNNIINIDTNEEKTNEEKNTKKEETTDIEELNIEKEDINETCHIYLKPGNDFNSKEMYCLPISKIKLGKKKSLFQKINVFKKAKTETINYKIFFEDNFIYFANDIIIDKNDESMRRINKIYNIRNILNYTSNKDEENKKYKIMIEIMNKKNIKKSKEYLIEEQYFKEFNDELIKKLKLYGDKLIKNEK